MKSAKISLWPTVLALVAGLLLPLPADALRVNVRQQGDSDRMVFSFDSGRLPDYTVTRDGTKSMLVTLPGDVWQSETKPGSKDYPGKLVKSIRVSGNTVRIEMKTNAFGFIRVPVSGKPQFVLQLYRDPIGARWKPSAPKSAPAPAAASAPARPAVSSQPAPAPRPAAATPEPAPAASAPAAQPAPSAAQGNEANLPPEQNASGERKPFFAVPYSVRTEVAPPPGQAQPAAPTPATAQPATAQPLTAQPVAPPPDQPQPVAAPPAQARPVASVPTPGSTSGMYPSSSELRFKAVNKSAEEVKFAELAGPGAKVSDVSPGVGGVVAPPSAEDGQTGGPVAPLPDSVSQPVSDVGQSVQATVAEPPAQAGGAVSGGVTQQPVEEQGGALQPIVTSDPVSGAGQAGGGVVAPPPMVVQGAPPPEPTPEEAARVVQPPPDEPAQVESVPAQEVAEQPAEAETQTPAAVPDGATEGTDVAVDNATLEAQARLEEIKNQIYEAQTLMFNGNLPEALDIYEKVLRYPELEPPAREEALYAVADIKKQLNRGDLAAKFDEIAQAYIEAMNANLRSNRVPSALLNLGLLNLQVGNFPESKAYFKILQEKYPDDDNIPSISYYWGEYYYRKGDYKKAADQFQYLIQTYPEHELVKDAAYYLADSLNRTGFYEQAFQIVDYIDKRWPDYYMENNEFLRLAGGVEMQLGKWAAAKNHYFTFYNLNPEASGADVVLARIGDIYVRDGEKEAARLIYEKAVQDFPTGEGGLVAKMRLAEEGIFDDPTMPQMGTVFNRPYNKRPEKVYQEIVEDFPENPLAPIAQLKLAMWYAFNKKYPEALTAAQDLIEKYPDSPLVGRARKLGDAVFVLAVPGMVDEERYGRVVRYWETYDFIGEKDTRVNDGTKLGVAMSYWKIGKPEEALKLLSPYLQKKQVKDVSPQALGMAVNIYLDGLAWKEIADLVAMVKQNWKLDEEQLLQIDYARAMALQNLGDDIKALPLWAELAKDVKVEPAFRAYAMYYMAKAAMERQDLRKVFVYSQEALSLLLQTDGDPEKIKDAVLMSIYATERSGRYGEALKWAREYDKYIKVDNPEWASTRFKLARIYRKAGAMDEWKALLNDIIEKKPESLQAQLAKSALETYDLEQQVQQYAPMPQ